jgi:hypothetical protein
LAVKHRHVQIKVYKKSAKYSYYRIAYRAEGKRITRSFETLAAAQKEAERIARQISKGEESVAVLTPKDALAYRFAREKLESLNSTPSASRPDPFAPDSPISLEDAIQEYAEAKRAFGRRRLIEAVNGFQKMLAQIKRVSIRQAADEFLEERDRLRASGMNSQRYRGN